LPRKRRRTKIPTPAWEPTRGALGRQFMGYSPRLYATVGIIFLILAAVGIVGFAFGSDYWADRQRPSSTAIQVGDSKYSLRYFTERLKMLVQQAGGPANQAAQPAVAIPAIVDQLVNETILLRFAQEMDVSATEDDIKNEIATLLGMAADDAGYDARFQEELSRSGLTEEEYKQMIEAAVLRNKMAAELENDVPASAESVHVRQIVVSDLTAADEIKQQVEQGADFAKLATERSLDTTTKGSGGEAGWIPRGLFPQEAEDLLFSLAPGGVETFSTASGAVVFQALEKADQAVEPSDKPAMAQRKLQDWLDEKRKQLDVRDLVSQDQEKASWAIKRAYGVT